MGMFDDPQYPNLVTRRPYNPADYQGMKGSGLYSALTDQASGANAQNGQNMGQAAQGYRTGAPDAGFANDNAKMQAAGQMQPWDEQQKMGQYQSYLGQQNNMDAWNQAMYQGQRSQAQDQQQGLGNLVGTLGGAYMGYKMGQPNTMGQGDDTFSAAMGNNQMGIDSIGRYAPQNQPYGYYDQNGMPKQNYGFQLS